MRLRPRYPYDLISARNPPPRREEDVAGAPLNMSRFRPTTGAIAVDVGAHVEQAGVYYGYFHPVHRWRMCTKLGRTVDWRLIQKLRTLRNPDERSINQSSGHRRAACRFSDLLGRDAPLRKAALSTRRTTRQCAAPGGFPRIPCPSIHILGSLVR